MTTADMPVPILEPVEPRAAVVEAPVAVGADESRTNRAITIAEQGVTVALGDLREAWIWRAAPPPLGDVIAVRMAEWEPFEHWRHRCVHRSMEHGIREISGVGWTCECHPCSPEVRKVNSRYIRLLKGWRAAWVTYNHTIAIPATLLLYVLAWLIQHPGRLFVSTSLVLVAIGVIFG